MNVVIYKEVAACLRTGYTTGREARAKALLREALGVKRLPGPLSEAVGVIREKIETRRTAKAATYHRPLAQRVANFVLQRYCAEIRRRGGETQIEGQYQTVDLEIVSRAGGLTLLHAEGWRQYSRAYGARRAALSYLCGVDDNGVFAVRVPGTITTVSDAVAWIEPAAVKQARAAGRTVLRQGDVYVIQTTRDASLQSSKELPAGHQWDPETRALRHTDDANPHATLTVAFPCKFVVQSAYQMGRSARRGRGD